MNTIGRRSILLGLALLFAAGTFTACLYTGESHCQAPQPLCLPAPTCDDKNDCGVNAWCVNGYCEYAYCTTSADCQKFQEGLVCDTEKNLCYDPSDGDAEAEGESL